MGRAARNIRGRVIMYADEITGSMKRAIEETNRRRKLQLAYNEAHGIQPQSIRKSADQVKAATTVADSRLREPAWRVAADSRRMTYAREIDLEATVQMIENEMKEAAEAMNFERAALLRDQLFECKARLEGKKVSRKKRKAWLAF